MIKVLMSGDEAIARGAWEAGVYFGSGYPGTPSTEILENFAKYPEIYAEWSINEKVALEAATGASLGGVRSIVTMKHVGLNVALDAFMTLAYTGINGGLVLVSADDPGMHSSQNEQDNRYLGKFAYVPVIEPSDSQEAKDMMAQCYEISEKFDLPVLFRITTRIAHSKSVVTLDENFKYSKVKKTASVPWEKYVMMPLNAKKRRIVIVDKYEKLRGFAEETGLNREEMADTDTGIITSGAAYQYVKEVFPGKSVFKIGLLNPLPAGRLKSFSSKVKKLYVVEELEPYIEEFLLQNGIKAVGKVKIPLIDELNPDIVRESFSGLRPARRSSSEVGTPDPGSPAAASAESGLRTSNIPSRPPQLCADCGHRGVFKVLSELKLTVMGDIGCYTLGALPPFSALHTCIDMGSAISHAHGFEKAGEPGDEVVSVIGDSTFMHSGITAIANLLYNKGNTLTIILDNTTTAMTGRQPHPASGEHLTMGKTANIDMEKMLRGMGVENITVIDPFKMKELRELILEYLKKTGVKVIIARRKCVLL